SRLQFGALGAWQTDNGPIEFGFRFPATTRDYPRGPGAQAAGPAGPQPAPRWNRRYHPISQGVAHSYQIRFRFGQKEAFPDITRNSWRWAWNTLNPAIHYIDVDQIRR